MARKCICDYRVSHGAIRHSPHALNSHTRPPCETPGLRPFVIECSLETLRAPCMSDRRRERLCEKKKERERDRQREKRGESEYFAWRIYTPDSSGLRSSLVTNRTTMREQTRESTDGDGTIRGMLRPRYYRIIRTPEYPGINEPCKFLPVIFI